MDYSDFVKLGFNVNEAKAYVALLRRGSADAGQLIKDTKFHKNIVYDNLEKLIDKGLVSHIENEGKKVFRVAAPDALSAYLQEEQEELDEKKALAAQLSENIKVARTKLPAAHRAEVYRGVKALKSFYFNMLAPGTPYVVIGAPKASVDIMGEAFWLNFNLRRIEKKVHVRMIFNNSLREYSKQVKHKLTEIRFMEQDSEPLTETHIWPGHVGIVVWSEEPVAFIIEDKEVEKSYREFFEKLWREAKE
jgi:DNA-binding MarR family transcriptional regulator